MSNALRKELENIPVPHELDMKIEQAIRRGKRAMTTGRILKPLAAVILLIFVFALSVNLSPAFAGYVSDRGMEALVNLFSFNKGIANVVERGFGDVHGASVTDQGITLTVEKAFYDGRKLFLAVKIESDRELKDAWLDDGEVHGLPGRTTSVTWRGPDADNEFWQFWEYDFLEAPELQGELLFQCTKIRIHYGTSLGPQSGILCGNWFIPIDVDTDLVHFEPKRMAVNELIALGDVQFTIDYVEIHPTVIDIEISWAQDNPVRITGFKNPRLIDAEGNEYVVKSSSISDTEVRLSLESTYFTDAADLTLAFDGVYTLPWGETVFIADIGNECVLEDGGFGIQFAGKEVINYPGKGRQLNVYFELAETAEVGDEQFLWMEHTVHDLSGNPYKVTTGHIDQEGRSKRYSIGFDAGQDVPSVVKVSVMGISRGIMKPVQVQLKMK